jgi:hypothetical protein
VPEERDVVAQLAEEQRLVHGHGTGGQDADRLVADLPPVAVRAVQDVAAPALGHARQVGQLVDQPGGHQQPAGRHLTPVVQGDAEAAVVLPSGCRDDPGHDLSPVAGQLVPADGQEFEG